MVPADLAAGPVAGVDGRLDGDAAVGQRDVGDQGGLGHHVAEGVRLADLHRVVDDHPDLGGDISKTKKTSIILNCHDLYLHL